MINLYFQNNHIDVIGKNEHKYVLLTAPVGENDVIGTIEYTLFEDTIHIDFVYVEPTYRRKGVATALYKELKKEMKDYPWAKSNYYTKEGLLLRDSFEKENNVCSIG